MLTLNHAFHKEVKLQPLSQEIRGGSTQDISAYIRTSGAGDPVDAITSCHTVIWTGPGMILASGREGADNPAESFSLQLLFKA
jgi:hypothetical protein